MKIDECTPEDVHTVGGGEFPPCVGLTSCALPEAQSNANIESSQTGVSTRSVHILSKSLRQRKSPIPSFLLSSRPRRRTNHQTTTCCPRIPNRKS